MRQDHIKFIGNIKRKISFIIIQRHGFNLLAASFGSKASRNKGPVN